VIDPNSMGGSCQSSALPADAPAERPGIDVAVGATRPPEALDHVSRG
jgi:hypothetical protein